MEHRVGWFLIRCTARLARCVLPQLIRGRQVILAFYGNDYTNIDLLPARTFPAVLGYGAATATAMAAFDYTQGFFGYSKDKEEDEFERRQKLRKAYQTPAEQTFAELGEGRGTWRSPSLFARAEVLSSSWTE